jgi:isoquinoline 1-oxidoreductase beta subunit
VTTGKVNETTDGPAASTDIDRREFLSTTAAVGGALVLGFWLPPGCARAPASPAEVEHVKVQPWYRDPTVPEINAWITIAPDDTVTIRVGQTEMGTGVFTSNPMIVADELQCDWSKVRAEYASANRDVREKAPEWTMKAPSNDITNPLGDSRTSGGEGVYRRMKTDSSGNIRESRYFLQLAGAEARERLLLAASMEWGVPVSELVAKDSVITHAGSNRRTTYGAIAAKAATVQLPDPSRITPKPPEKWTLMGTEQKNRDVPLKVTGQAAYGIDMRLPNMLYAAVRVCPVWGGDVRSYNFDAIKARPGVHSVVRLPLTDVTRGCRFHSGGVAVVADSWWRAQSALDAMPIEWDYGRSAHVSSATLLKEHLAVLNGPGPTEVNVGNVDAAMRRAAKVVEATYTVPYVPRARMEPGNATVLVTDNKVEIWLADQHPQEVLQYAHELTGIAPENIYVHLAYLGGGYGSGGNGPYAGQAIVVAQALKGRPVKLVASRDEDWGSGTRYQPMGVGIMKAGLDADGWPIAMEVRSSSQYSGDQLVRGLTAPPYFVPNYRLTCRTLDVGSSSTVSTARAANVPVPVGNRRATGARANSFYMESFIDELAHAAGKDRYQYRRELIARNPVSPGKGVWGFARRNEWLTALDMAAEMSGWGTPLPEGWARGLAIEDRRRTSRPHSTICAQVHTVEVTRRGQVRLHRVDVAFEQGFRLVHPVSVRKQIEGQIAWGYSDAIYQETTVRDGRAVERNFDTFPVSRMSEYPKEVNIRFFPTKAWLYGAGEEAIPQVMPAIYSAVFEVTGKRIRSLPLKNHDVSWGTT